MALELLWKHVQDVRIPTPNEKIHKDECAFSFDTPESETGLYVCMTSFLGFGRKHVEKHYLKTKHAVYLHLQRIRKQVSEETPKEEGKSVTRLGIGVEGGFDLGIAKVDYEEANSLVILPDFVVIPLPEPTLPEEVQAAIAQVLSAPSANKLEEARALAGTWDGEKRPVSKHAESLTQLNNGIRIPPKGWKCEQCDKTDNLWLNLTDGKILCGRKFFDGTGGNNHAVDYYRQTRYPLAVKLGTITPSGADVFSYDEDDMVEDPHLARHLLHFGIDLAQMEKTDKSMIELEIDLNQRIGEWVTIQEAGSQLKPVCGPSYTGIANLGNSCYLNSVMQVVFSIPAFQHRYFDSSDAIFKECCSDPTSDFTVQMSKLACGLLSGDYSRPCSNSGDVEQVGIRPTTFKLLIGRGHAEFSTKRQQDARDFFLHLVNLLERNTRHASNPADCFKFRMEDRMQCAATRRVKYVQSTEYVLCFPIPMEAAINRAEVVAYETKKSEMEARGEKIDNNELVRPRIPLSACIEAWASPRHITDFYSAGRNTTAAKTLRMATFPDYLMIQLEKYTIGEGWVPKKLDVSIDVPDVLDLSELRARGFQPGEELMPEEEVAQKKVELDSGVLTQLMEMGFSLQACQRAVYFTNNSGAESATAWLMEHMCDPDINDPFDIPGSSGGGSSDEFVPNAEGVDTLMAMGFTREQAVRALKSTDNNLERAADWIFSHAAELDAPMDTSSSAAAASPPVDVQFTDGAGKYQLEAFISHMGTSTMVGHYVCHILKEGRWIIFNDSKVALSEHPPKDLGYLYLYRRIQ